MLESTEAGGGSVVRATYNATYAARNDSKHNTFGDCVTATVAVRTVTVTAPAS